MYRPLVKSREDGENMKRKVKNTDEGVVQGTPSYKAVSLAFMYEYAGLYYPSSSTEIG